MSEGEDERDRKPDIVGRLRDLLESDHERGCEGRTYSCACGHDNRIERALHEAADEIERLRKEKRP